MSCVRSPADFSQCSFKSRELVRMTSWPRSHRPTASLCSIGVNFLGISGCCLSLFQALHIQGFSSLFQAHQVSGGVENTNSKIQRGNSPSFRSGFDKNCAFHTPPVTPKPYGRPRFTRIPQKFAGLRPPPLEPPNSVVPCSSSGRSC